VLSAYDVRGAVLEVASRWVGLAYVGRLPVYEQQLVGLEALQIYAPLAHALGLGPLAAEMEDAAFRVSAGPTGPGAGGIS
jgi:GTP pyrophosphokinase